MKVEESTVTKLTITGALSLDPITVFLEDIEPRRGRITIRCYDKAWTTYWGGMGDKTIAQFFCSCDEGYIANCLVPGIRSMKYDAQQAPDVLKKIVIERRQQDAHWNSRQKNWNYDSLDKDAARELWDRIEDEIFYDDPAGNCELICDVVGHEEWWNALPEAPNPDYQYLCRIIKVVQEALSSKEVSA